MVLSDYAALAALFSPVISVVVGVGLGVQIGQLKTLVNGNKALSDSKLQDLKESREACEKREMSRSTELEGSLKSLDTRLRDVERKGG